MAGVDRNIVILSPIIEGPVLPGSSIVVADCGHKCWMSPLASWLDFILDPSYASRDSICLDCAVRIVQGLPAPPPTRTLRSRRPPGHRPNRGRDQQQARVQEY